MRKLILSLAGLLLAGQVFALSSPLSDPRLIGVWEGQRSTATGCFPLSWTVDRKPNGLFDIDFFGPGKRHLFRQSGRWWVQGDSIFVQEATSAEPDEYRFTIHHQDAIEFVHVRASASADCKNEPPFTDIRVRKAR